MVIALCDLSIAIKGMVFPRQELRRFTLRHPTDPHQRKAFGHGLTRIDFTIHGVWNSHELGFCSSEVVVVAPDTDKPASAETTIAKASAAMGSIQLQVSLSEEALGEENRPGPTYDSDQLRPSARPPPDEEAYSGRSSFDTARKRDWQISWIM